MGSLAGLADLSAPRDAAATELARRERELAAAAVERSRLAEELAAHREHLVTPRPAAAADAHLRRPASATGATAVSRERRRVLRVWATVSTPLLVLTIVVLLLGPPLAFLTSLVVFVVAFLAVEAIARGRLAVFLGGLLSTAVAVVVVVALVTGLPRNWQLVLAVLLGAAALILLVVNVRELRRG